MIEISGHTVVTVTSHLQLRPKEAPDWVDVTQVPRQAEGGRVPVQKVEGRTLTNPSPFLWADL